MSQDSPGGVPDPRTSDSAVAAGAASSGTTSPRAAELLAALGARSLTVAVAESLTGGMVTSALVGIFGASRSLRGGVVAYATDLKAGLLGVDQALLAARGPVDLDVAEQMARGVAERLGADMGLATTGVAGPEPVASLEPGTAYIAVSLGGRVEAVEVRADGDRQQVRAQVSDAVLVLAVDVARTHSGRTGDGAGNTHGTPGVG